MRHAGREIDVIGLWGEYVEFPINMDESDQYLPKVQCPNPEHDTHKKHFQINQVDGLVHCFAMCGISGTFVHAIRMIEGCDEKEARQIILRHETSRAGATRKNVKRLGSVRQQGNSGADAIVPDLSFSTYIPPAGMEYLAERGIDGNSVAAWELGWHIDELRIVIPAKDVQGQTRFLIRRAVKPKDQPKYLYTEGVAKTSLLFGACNVSLGLIRSKGMILVEGSLDAIRLHQHGFKNACAILGTGISKAQAGILAQMRPQRVYLMFDKDVSGIHNIEIAQKRLYKYPLLVCRYPKGKSDPAELTKEEATRSISKAVPVHRFFQTRNRRKVRVGY